MKVSLKRGTPIDFDFEDAHGKRWETTIQPITVGQYRQALMLESASPAIEPTERLVKQAVILCGDANTDFVNALDPEQLAECVQCLVAAYAGYDPAAMVEVARALKKKTLTELVLHLASQAMFSEN